MPQEKTIKKSLLVVNCVFDEYWWNDPEQRNYFLHRCGNPKNTGGEVGYAWGEDYHDERTYSCWHKNEGMKYRCWSDSGKIAKCPFAKDKDSE